MGDTFCIVGTNKTVFGPVGTLVIIDRQLLILDQVDHFGGIQIGLIEIGIHFTNGCITAVSGIVVQT
ncbi:hypothetical protein D3C72_2242300 [compost metagenome]